MLVAPGRVLQTRRLHAQHQVLRVAHAFNAGDFFAKLARCAFVGQQGGKNARQVAAAERHFQLHAFGGKGFGAGAAQGFGGIQQGLAAQRVGAEVVLGRVQPGKLGVLLGKVLHRVVHHAVGIGQRKLNAFVERGVQRFVGLGAAMLEDDSFKVGFQRGIGQQRAIKRPPHQRFGGRVVFQQLVVGGQFHLRQHGQRRTAQQGGKPAVKGAHLHLTPAGQNTLV